MPRYPKTLISARGITYVSFKINTPPLNSLNISILRAKKNDGEKLKKCSSLKSKNTLASSIPLRKHFQQDLESV